MHLLLLLLFLCLPALAEPLVVREIVAVKYGDINEVKTLLATLVPDVQYEVDAKQNTLILTGNPGAIEQVKELLAEFDRPSEQFVIDCKVIDLTEGGRKSLGLAGDGPRVNVLARTPFVITSNLQFLVSQSETKVLAAPRIATQNNQAALIHIGDRLPITAFDPVSGEFTTTSLDLGLRIDVLPTLRHDGFLDLKVDANTSALTDLVSGQYACVSVNTFKHEQRMKDGDTVVLGGLLPLEISQAVNRIPLLADLPILGALFRSIHVTKSKSEIVVLLTPHVMK